MKNKKYDKMMDIAFTVLTDKEEGATNEEIIRGISRRLVILSENEDEIQEAVGESDVVDISDDENALGRHNLALDDVCEKRQGLIDEVLEQIKKDIVDGDFTAIEELIKFLPSQMLKAYLPEK